MKWIFSNGIELIIRDVSAPLMIFKSDGRIPTPLINEILEDTKARDFVKDLMEMRLYKREK